LWPDALIPGRAAETVDNSSSSNTAPSNAATSLPVNIADTASSDTAVQSGSITAAPSTETPSPAAPSVAATEAITPVESSDPTPTVGKLINLRVIAGGQIRRAQVMITPDARTVGAALRAVGIKINRFDRVQPAANTLAWNNMKVRITRVRADVRQRRLTLNPETRYLPTTNLPRGARQKIQTGLPGTKTITERVWSRDGKVTLRQVVSQKVTLAPRPTVVALGARPHYIKMPYHRRYARAFTLASRYGSPRDRTSVQSSTQFAAKAPQGSLRAVRSLMVVATGYSPDPRENGGYTVTATGLPIGYGAAAVDPRVIPLGTKLYVEGYGYAFACDVGGAIKGHRIDLAFDSYYIANTKGRKKMRVWILAP
jgi:3D (Asp-Asp-Asp) domain-containing protein